MKTKSSVYFILLFVIGTGCSSVMTNTEFYEPIIYNLKTSDYDSAAGLIEAADSSGEYSEKDRVLLHLDKGIIYHYNGEYEKSNLEFEKAENAIEELFTESISKGAASVLLNDNVLAYSGEVYEDLYLNVFKALNYLHLNRFDDAYVEVKRISNKLKELDVEYEEYISEFNTSNDSNIKIDPTELDYYNNVLSNYLSFLIFRAEGEEDNSRISLENLQDTWKIYNDIYQGPIPAAIEQTTSEKITSLNFIAFTGTAPIKKSVGARITSFNDYIVISDPTDFHIQPIPISGVKYGWNFKFEFPELVEQGTFVDRIEVYIDSSYAGELELLENMSSVARKTFETHKSIIFFKTIARAVLKGVGSNALGKEIKEEAKGTVGDILVGILNAAVDMTEHADLRSWRTMPGYAFVGEIPIEKGIYDIEIKFVADDNTVLMTKRFEKYNSDKIINLLEAFYLD